MNEPYRVVVNGGEAEIELKKSRFIAHVAPVTTEEEAQAFIEEIKKAYYDARHNCYAYVLGKDGDKVKFSDDGEPSQTAGLPMYNVLKETKVRNVCVVVTRYFGGTLLGAGPLARMYVDATKEGLNASEIGVMKYGIEGVIACDYSDGEKIKRFLEKEQIMISDTVYTDKVKIYIRTGFERFESLQKETVSLTSSRANLERLNEAYFLEKEQ